MSRRPTVANRLTFLACLWGSSILVAFSFGFSWANLGNQPSYMLAPMMAIDPGFLSSDWLARNTTLYHENFVYLTNLLAWIGPLPWTAALSNLALNIFGILILVSMLRHLGTPHFAVASLLLIALLFADETRSVGLSRIFSPGLQPSQISGFLWLAAVVCFIRGRYLLSGLATAVAGFFHINFLVLGFPAFGLAHLILGHRSLLLRGILQLGPSLPLLALELPRLLSAASGPHAEAAREILQQIRAPHHYIPMSYIEDFIPFVLWLGLSLFLATTIRSAILRRRFVALILGFSLPVAAATFLTTVIFIPQVSQLFVWRLAPFGIALSQVVLVHALVTASTTRSADDARSSRRVLVIVLAASVIAWALWYATDYYEGSYLAIGAIVLFSGAALILQSVSDRRPLAASHLTTFGSFGAIVVIALALTPTLAQRLYQTISTSTILPTDSRDDQQRLYAWVLTTPESARFLTPPNLIGFRLRGERAIVVDWQTQPMKPPELLEWYHRIELLSGIEGVAHPADAARGYEAMTPERLALLRKLYDLDYALFKAPGPSAVAAYEVAYENKSFVVVRLNVGPIGSGHASGSPR